MMDLHQECRKKRDKYDTKNSGLQNCPSSNATPHEVFKTTEMAEVIQGKNRDRE